VQVFLADSAWQTVGEEPIDYGSYSDSSRALNVQDREVAGIKMGGVYFREDPISKFSQESAHRINRVTELISQGQTVEGAKLAREMIHGEWDNFTSGIGPAAFGV
jgi:hypothetical protein